MAIKPDWKINVPSVAMTVAASAAGCLAAFFVLQGDVRALTVNLGRVEQRVEKIETAREADRNTVHSIRLEIVDMKGDIRVVRQILEGMRPLPAGPPR